MGDEGANVVIPPISWKGGERRFACVLPLVVEPMGWINPFFTKLSGNNPVFLCRGKHFQIFAHFSEIAPKVNNFYGIYGQLLKILP